VTVCDRGDSVCQWWQCVTVLTRLSENLEILMAPWCHLIL
jgi:hypothetical protein